jgi:spore maturation protein CgeB
MTGKKVLMIAPKFYGIDEAICHAFEELGFDVVLINNRTKLSFYERIAKKLAKMAPIISFVADFVLKGFLIKENHLFLQKVKDIRPDLLFIVKGESVLPEKLREIKKYVGVAVAYIWDDPFYSYAGAYSDRYRRSNFENSMGLYDFIFVYDRFYVEAIKRRGIDKVGYLPLAASPKKYAPIEITQADRAEYGFDICFVGVPYPNRIDILDRLKEYKLGVFGDNWFNYYAQRGKSVPSYYKGKAYGEIVIKLYLCSKIVLNMHDPEAREGLNTRTFDILAAGGFEVVDFKPSLKEHFNLGKEIMTYTDKEDLNKVVKYYLDKPELRAKIVEEGRKRVLADHTWYHRIKEAMRSLASNGVV